MRVELFVINYNGGELLERTLESALSQTYPDKRVILSDNASTDDSLARARRFEARGLEVRARKTGTGDCYGHCNVCIGEITAPYAAILHGDDLYEPTMVEKQVRLLEAEPKLEAVLTGGRAIDSAGRPLWLLPRPPAIRHPVLDPRQVYEHTLARGSGFLLAPSALFRSSVFQRLGPMRAELYYCGDVELWFRCLLRGGGLGYLDEPLLRYRISKDQGSNRYDKERVDESEYFSMADEYLAEFPVSAETRRAFEALRRLDRFQAGLNRLALRGEADMLLENLHWLQSPEGRRLRGNFGSVDRLKLLGARFISPAARTAAGSWLARALIRQTDPWSSVPLRLALRAKRLLA